MRGPGSGFRRGGNPKSREEYHEDKHFKREWSDGDEDYNKTAGHFYQDEGFQPTSIVSTVYRKPRQYADLHEYDGIPVIDRVPTAVGYRSQDSADILVEEKSRASRYSVDARDKERTAGEILSDDDNDDKYSAYGKPRERSASIWSDSDDSNAPIWKSYSEDDGDHLDPSSPRRSSPRRSRAQRDDSDDRRKSRKESDRDIVEPEDDRNVRRNDLDNENERRVKRRDDDDNSHRADKRDSKDLKGSKREPEDRPSSRQGSRGGRSKDPEEPIDSHKGSGRGEQEPPSSRQGNKVSRSNEHRDVRRNRSDEDKEEKVHLGSASDEDSTYRDASPIRSKSISKPKASKDSADAASSRSFSEDESDADEDVAKYHSEEKQASKKKNSKKSEDVRASSVSSSKKKTRSAAAKKKKAIERQGPLRNLTAWVRGSGPGSRSSKSSRSDKKKPYGVKHKKEERKPKEPTKNDKMTGKGISAPKGKSSEKITANNSSDSSDKSGESQERKVRRSDRDEDKRETKNGDRRSRSTRRHRDNSIDSYDSRGRDDSPPPRSPKRKEDRSRSARDAGTSSPSKKREPEESMRNADEKSKGSTDAPVATTMPEPLPDVSAMHLEDEPEPDWSTVGGTTVGTTTVGGTTLGKDPDGKQPSAYISNLQNNGCGAIASCLLALDGLSNMGYKDYSILDWGTDRKLEAGGTVKGDESITLPTYYDESIKSDGRSSAASQGTKSLHLDGSTKNEEKSAKPEDPATGPAQTHKQSDQDIEAHPSIELGIRSRSRDSRDRKRESSRERGRKVRGDDERSQDRSRQRRREDRTKSDDDRSRKSERKAADDRRRDRDDDRKKADDRREDGRKQHIDNSKRRVEEKRSEEGRSTERTKLGKKKNEEERSKEKKEERKEERSIERKRSPDDRPRRHREETNDPTMRKRSEENRYDDERSYGSSENKKNILNKRVEDDEVILSPELEGRTAAADRSVLREDRGRENREPIGRRHDMPGPPGTPKEVRVLKLDNDERRRYVPEEVPHVLSLPVDCISITSIEIPGGPDLRVEHQEEDGSVSILGLAKPPTKGIRSYDTATGAPPPIELKKGKPSFIGKLLNRKKATS